MAKYYNRHYYACTAKEMFSRLSRYFEEFALEFLENPAIFLVL